MKMTRNAELKDAKIKITHQGEDYYRIVVNGQESEVGLFEGNVIRELLRRLRREE